MTFTMTTSHVWVKHTVTPVEVLVDHEGEPIVFVDPDQQLIAEEEAAYGCNRCGNPMVSHFNTACSGEEQAG